MRVTETQKPVSTTVPARARVCMACQRLLDKFHISDILLAEAKTTSEKRTMQGVLGLKRIDCMLLSAKLDFELAVVLFALLKPPVKHMKPAIQHDDEGSEQQRLKHADTDPPES